ncbi:MAG TPA: glycoside hydrolase TIM-barrel-like domain-containing protein [Rickettsiales bacterium]|nr:glycoside hydrolase TIM-barrel-like domain-containing protein [Rickettsiales bacterium]
MTNFVITTVAGTINSKKSSILNTFKSSPFYELFNEDENTWKKDKVSSRLSDLTVQKSGYNEIIPTIYGTVRLAGNIIWATDITEVENTYTTTYSTGKTSTASQTTTEYYYYANVAIGICNGEVSEIGNVWADTDLIDLSDYTYRFYYGTETQEPDSLIQSNEGTDATPAYRGLCYIVFENLPLAEFGNRIPNFTFEITRNFAQEDEAENLVSAVNLIPGCGEFVYDTTVISKLNGLVWLDTWQYTGTQSRINQNNNSGVADSIVATEQLKSTLPNCNWVAPVVVWFGDNLDIASCTIEPRVEFKLDPEYPTILTSPDEWQVGGYTRYTANLISSDNGTLRYGGTVSDNSLVRYLQYLKEEGYNIMFYPMMFMDIENKPWRGYLTGSASDVSTFFTKSGGYNAFILHYANLVKDYCDVFIIGSEMIGLTSVYTETDGVRSYPAVDCFIDLASQVRAIVGTDVKIAYAGDWSEYHHTDDGWYNMDKLWADSNIDFVGIDAYFPLTDKKESLITKQDIKDGWTSGEGYDWIYTDDDRTTKETIESKYAWKNIQWWWENYHINPDETTTEWVPQSKKIWFTEYGFASVDGTTNQPNKFYDPNCVDGGFPRFSEGNIDYFAQRRAIQATEEVWADSTMVERKFLWAWDARPYPFFPNLLSVWADGNIWYYGHWINGKLGNLMFSNMIKTLFEDAGLDYDLIGDIDIYDSINGIALNSRVSVNEVLTILQKAFFFDYYEQDGKLYLTSKNTTSSLTIYDDDLVEIEDGVYFKTSIIGENELPYKLDLSYVDKDFDYETGHTYAERASVDSNKIETESLPLVITAFKAKQIAEKLLYSMWLEKIIYEFKLPPKYIYLNPSDVITLNINDTDIILRLANIKINEDNTITIKAVKCDNSLYNFEKEEESYEDIETILPTSETNIQVFELPAIENILTDIDKPEVFFTTNANEKGWTGCAIYSAKTGSSNFNVINESKTNSIVGTCLNTLGDARPYYFDYSNSLYVGFSDMVNTDVLETADMFDLLDGENLALVGDEIIQFKTVELQDDGSFKLSQLLRGQYGTEAYISTHTNSEKFIYLNKGLINQQYTINNVGTSYDYKVITFKDSIDNATEETLELTGKNLDTLPVCHVKVLDLGTGDFTITWCARIRGNYNWKDGEESLDSKSYTINITDSSSSEVVRTTTVNDTMEWTYTSSMISEDGVGEWEVGVQA